MEKLGVEIGLKINSFEVLDVWMDGIGKASRRNIKMVKVKCLCGNVRSKPWAEIKRGRTKTCGCGTGNVVVRKPSGIPAKMEAGQKYWYFTVIRVFKKKVSSKKVSERTRSFCEVSCVCGNKRVHVANAIYNGKIKSCGCAMSELRDDTISNRVNVTKSLGKAGIERRIDVLGRDKMKHLLAADDFWVYPNMRESEFMAMKTEMFRNTYEFLK